MYNILIDLRISKKVMLIKMCIHEMLSSYRQGFISCISNSKCAETRLCLSHYLLNSVQNYTIMKLKVKFNCLYHTY